MRKSDFCLGSSCINLTDRHVFSMFTYLPLTDHQRRRKDAVHIFDLLTHESRRAIGDEVDHDDFEWSRCEVTGTEGGTLLSLGGIKICDGMIRLETNSDSIHLFDLTSGDPKGILGAQRKITSRVMGNPDSCIEILDVIEVKPGLCLFKTDMKPRDRDDSDMGTFGISDSSILEMVAWKGEKMPKALKAWSEWLTDNFNGLCYIEEMDEVKWSDDDDDDDDDDGYCCLAHTIDDDDDDDEDSSDSSGSDSSGWHDISASEGT